VFRSRLTDSLADVENEGQAMGKAMGDSPRRRKVRLGSGTFTTGDGEALRDASIAQRLAVELACMGPIGRMPTAPGTWGSLATAVFAPFLFLPLSPWARLLVLALLFFAGAIWATTAERVLGRKDPQPVVVDEVLGQLVCFAPFATITVWEIVIGFFVFRFMDIVKPYPIRRSETWLPAGYGIMLDDLLAGLYAAAVLTALRYAVFAS
jgi:phosphatidylglycerophosphatase A